MEGIMKRFTIEELTAILPMLQGPQKEAVKKGISLGINKTYTNALRSLLGYTAERPRRMEDSDRKKAVRMINSGNKTVTEISRECNCTRSAIYQLARRLGKKVFSPTHDFWTPIKVMRLVELTNKGLTQKAIASQLGGTFQQINNMQTRLYNKRNVSKWLTVYEKTGGIKVHHVERNRHRNSKNASRTGSRNR